MNNITRKNNKKNAISIHLSSVMTGLVVCLVGIVCACVVTIFTNMYRDSVEQNAITNSEQVVSQVENMVSNYTDDMIETMEVLCFNMDGTEEGQDAYFQNLITVRKDLEAITVHSSAGDMIGCWSDGNELKEYVANNLSYTNFEGNDMFVSTPHVQNLFKDYYPWVVTFSEKMQIGGK